MNQQVRFCDVTKTKSSSRSTADEHATSLALADRWSNALSFVTVDGCRTAFLDRGAGDPVVFLHGNLTSSILWHSVVAVGVEGGRWVIPDLPGFGSSEGIDDYSPGRLREWLSGFLDAVGLDGPITFVVHEMGGMIAFDWAAHHPDRVRGIAYTEAFVQPLRSTQVPEAGRGLIEGIRSEAGDALVIGEGVEMDAVLPLWFLRSDVASQVSLVRAVHRDEVASRRAALELFRSLPIDYEFATADDAHAKACAALDEASRRSEISRIPKLFLNADPGHLLVGSARDYCRTWANQTEVTIEARHLVPLDNPSAVAETLARWLPSLP